jgi:hypothetical protein
MAPSYTYSFHATGCASVAQWQSTGFVNQWLWVQLPPLASRAGKSRRSNEQGPPANSRSSGTKNCGDHLPVRPLSGSLFGQTWMGRWPSGQWHQTVNLTGLALRGFESLSAHCSDIFTRPAGECLWRPRRGGALRWNFAVPGFPLEAGSPWHTPKAGVAQW